MNNETGNIETYLADVIIGLPQDFSVGERHFQMFPLTFAKMLIRQRHIDRLGINMDILKASPYLEAMRVAHEGKEECCHIIALHTMPNSREAFFDTPTLTSRKKFFAANMEEEDVAAMMIALLTCDTTKDISAHLGLDKERERMDKIMAIKAKHGKNNISFGGKGVFGAFIGQLKEMGYSDDDILFKYGYSYLQLMLADKITSVYLSDEELGELPTSEGGTFLDGNDPASKAAFLAQLKKSGVEV